MITATIIGRLGRDAEEVKAATSGINLNLASDQGWGEKRRTNWVRVTFWGKRAEILRPMLIKGVRIAVCGELQTSEYNGKLSLECKAWDIQILSERKEATDAPPAKGGGYDESPF
jgi:single-strand DNA-binding protein